jgi:DNA-binding transcriptional ArsR family regulator
MAPTVRVDDPKYVKAMSHPLRVRIFAMLQERAMSPVQLASLLGASLGVVSYHVRTLHGLGLVELVGETRVRGAVEHHYQAREAPVISDDAWRAATPMAKQAVVGAALQNVQAYTTAAAAEGGFDRAQAHLTRTLLRLDEQGFAELSHALAHLHAEAERIEREARERVGEGTQEDAHAEHGFDAGLVLMLFEARKLTSLTA